MTGRRQLFTTAGILSPSPNFETGGGDMEIKTAPIDQFASFFGKLCLLDLRLRQHVTLLETTLACASEQRDAAPCSKANQQKGGKSRSLQWHAVTCSALVAERLGDVSNLFEELAGWESQLRDVESSLREVL